MKKKIYFITAVIFSLLLPFLFSTVYLYDQYINNEDKIKLAKIDSEPEIFYKSSKKINQLEDVAILDENFETTKPYEFSVLFSDAVNDSDTYQVYLTDIELPETSDLSSFKWRLLFLDNDLNQYIQLSSGNFENIMTEKMTISPRIKISNKNIHRFKFYYYLAYNPLSTGSYVGSTFKATIEVE